MSGYINLFELIEGFFKNILLTCKMNKILLASFKAFSLYRVYVLNPPMWVRGH